MFNLLDLFLPILIPGKIKEEIKEECDDLTNIITPNPIKRIMSVLFDEEVTPKAGCILHCELAFGYAEHSGIYVGKGKIIELRGDGEITEVTKNSFLNDSLLRTGVKIYVACDKEKNPLYAARIAKNARSLLREKRDYNPIMDNCHQFTSGCITGEFENADNFFWMLETTIIKEMNNGEPITWLVADI